MLRTIVLDIISIAATNVTIKIRSKRGTAVVAETASAAKITVQAKRLITLAAVVSIPVEIEQIARRSTVIESIIIIACESIIRLLIAEASAVVGKVDVAITSAIFKIVSIGVIESTETTI